MDQPNCWPRGVNNVNRATISNVDSKRDLPLGGDKAIKPGEVRVLARRSLDNIDLITVHLFSRQEWPVGNSKAVPRGPVSCFQQIQRFSLVFGNIDTGHASNE